MSQKAAELAYRAIKATARVVYPRMTCQGTERIPREPVVLVGNHSQSYGPVVGELYMPMDRRTWCVGEMMHREEVADYAFRDFWIQHPRWTHWFYKGLAHAITPLSVLIFNQAQTIPVYHDHRVITTFRQTVQTLEAGRSVLIFPEHWKTYNHILYDFQDRFIDVAKLYYRRSGKALAFVPMYIAPKLKTISFGDPVYFDPTAPMETERARIKQLLMDRITALAEAQPRHRVIPYRPGKKRDYPFNRPEEGSAS